MAYESFCQRPHVALEKIGAFFRQNNMPLQMDASGVPNKFKLSQPHVDDIVNEYEIQSMQSQLDMLFEG